MSSIERLFSQLEEIGEILKKYWILFILVMILAAGVGGVFAAMFVPNVYYSTAKLYVRPYKENHQILAEDFTVSQDLAEDCTEIIQSTEVMNQVIANLGLQDWMTAEALQEQIYVYTDYDSRMINIIGADTTPEGAQKITGMICIVSMEQIDYILDGNWVALADDANYPESQEYPIVWKICVQSAILAALFLFFVCVLISMRERKIKTKKDIERYLGVPMLGIIQKKKKSGKSNAD